MPKMMEVQDLQKISLPELKELKSKKEQERKELESLKLKKGKNWGEEEQATLSNLVVYLVDIDEAIEAKESESGQAKTVEPSDKLIRLKLVKGVRFDPYTGEEMAKPYKQVFTYSEWLLFKGNFKRLGITIVEVVSDPYGEVKDYVTKNEKKDVNGAND